MSEIGYRLRGFRIGAVLAIVAAAGFLVWLLFIRTSDDESTVPTPVAAGEADLTTLAAEVGHPIYWAGSRDGAPLELTQTEGGNIFVRYLEADAEIGDPDPDFLTVGTYPFPDAIDALEKIGDKKGAEVHPIEGGGVVLTQEAFPNSFYLAYPGEDLQIEVYGPDSEEALDLATSGRIRPLG